MLTELTVHTMANMLTALTLMGVSVDTVLSAVTAALGIGETRPLLCRYYAVYRK